MNVLFLTLIDFYSIEDNNIYADLLREFRKNGHSIYTLSPVEKRNLTQGPERIEEDNSSIIKVQIGNIQKTNLIEKGISTLSIEKHFIKAIKKHLNNVKFDLVLYSTPPITLGKSVKYVKDRDNAFTYLLLKDIFPQNAVDIGMLKTTGLKGIIYKSFLKKEIDLYNMSDVIGCMSQANVEFIIKHNPQVNKAKVEVCPNSIEIISQKLTPDEIIHFRSKYDVPLDKTVFIYGGNLGKPQGIDNIIKSLDYCSDLTDAYFLIVGSGTEYNKLQTHLSDKKYNNIKLLPHIEKSDYDKLVAASDVGLIFLDHRFTIPNFPSRLLSYMQASLPVIAATDVNTDIGHIAENANFGFWNESNDPKEFKNNIQKMLPEETRSIMGQNSFDFLINNYSVEKGYNIIIKHFE